MRTELQIFGITEEDVTLITPLATKLNQGKPPVEIGAWGLLPLCCGLIYGRTFGGGSAVVESINVQQDSKCRIQDSLNIGQLIWNFHDILTTWSSDPCVRATGETRVDRILSGKQATEEVRQYMIAYFSLAVALQNAHDNKSDLVLDHIRTWADSTELGWHWLFVGAGCLLANRADFPGQSIYSSFIGMNAEPMQSDLKTLFEHFRGIGERSTNT